MWAYGFSKLMSPYCLKALPLYRTIIPGMRNLETSGANPSTLFPFLMLPNPVSQCLHPCFSADLIPIICLACGSLVEDSSEVFVWLTFYCPQCYPRDNTTSYNFGSFVQPPKIVEICIWSNTKCFI